MDFLFVTHLMNGVLMIAMPLGLAVFLTRRWKLGWRLWLIGAATFILSQAGHIPFLDLAGVVLNRTPLVNLSKEGQLVFNAIFLGLSAGLFEELFRYGMFRWWAKDARSWRKGVLTGAGHGGAEAVIFGGLVLYAFLQYAALRNADLSKLISPDQFPLVQQEVATYWSLTWYQSLTGALERFFTIPTQIAFAVLVLQTFTRKQRFWIWLAVLYHALLDAAAVLVGGTLGVYSTEAVAGVFAVTSIAIILALRSPEPVAPAGVPPAVITPRLSPKPIEETPENFEKTRYQ
jgi:uncharacterized membrane protein YhfC